MDRHALDMTQGRDDVSLIPGCMSPSSGEEETLFGSGLIGRSRTCAYKYTWLILCTDEMVFLHLSACLFPDPVGGITLMHAHTWLMFTVGSVSLAGFLLLVILVTAAG